MINPRFFSRKYCLTTTVTVLALAGYSLGSYAQSLDSLVAKGGPVHLRTAYHLDHMVVVPSNTQLVCDSGASISDNSSTKPLGVLQLRGQNISIEGCDIFATSAQVVIVLAGQTTDVAILKNHIHSLDHAHGILIDAPGIHRLKVQNNTIDDVGYGILQNVHAFDASNILIEGNTFSSIWSDAIELNDPVTSTCCGAQLKDVQASEVTIRNNKFRIPRHEGSTLNAGFCVGIAGAHDIDVSDNDCVSWHEGVHVEDRAYNIKVVGNSVTTDDQTGAGAQAAIQIIDGHHMVISKNKIKDASRDGIHLDYDPTHQASDIEISQNEISGCGRYGLFIAGGSIGPMNSKIHDNVVTGCAEPIFLTGKLQSLSIRSNRLTPKNGCIFHFEKQPTGGDVEIKDNQDPSSGASATATCAGPQTKGAAQAK